MGKRRTEINTMGTIEVANTPTPVIVTTTQESNFLNKNK